MKQNVSLSDIKCVEGTQIVGTKYFKTDIT